MPPFMLPSEVVGLAVGLDWVSGTALYRMISGRVRVSLPLIADGSGSRNGLRQLV